MTNIEAGKRYIRGSIGDVVEVIGISHSIDYLVGRFIGETQVFPFDLSLAEQNWIEIAFPEGVTDSITYYQAPEPPASVCTSHSWAPVSGRKSWCTRCNVDAVYDSETMNYRPVG